MERETETGTGAELQPRSFWRRLALATAGLSLVLVTAGGPWPSAGADSSGDEALEGNLTEAPAPSQDGVDGGLGDGSSDWALTPDGFNPLPDQIGGQDGGQQATHAAQAGGQPVGSGAGPAPADEPSPCAIPAV